LLKLTPEDVKARFNLGLELTSAGQPAEAEQQFSEALKYQPLSDKLHNSLGIALSQQGKLDAAASEFERAIQLNPEFPWPYLNYAIVLQRKGIAGAAVTNYTKALQFQPDWGEALDKLAFLLATCPDPQWQDPAKAVKLSAQANDLTQRKSPDLLETLAIAYGAAGEFSNAIATAELAQKQARTTGLQPLVAKLENELANYRMQKTAAVDWKTPPASIILRR
jgi:tetratricopeptide (TPR) repeat protein